MEEQARNAQIGVFFQASKIYEQEFSQFWIHLWLLGEFPALRWVCTSIYSKKKFCLALLKASQKKSSGVLKNSRFRKIW